MSEQANYPQALIDEAHELFTKYNGRRFTRIERELRAKGWHRFRRELLYDRTNRYGQSLGWPRKYGWNLPASKPSERVAANAFETWLSTTFPEFTWNWRYQRFIYRRLAKLANGEIRRLMIFMPPRHGKSEMVTVRYTAWRLLEQHGLNVILGSYNQKLADKFSRKIRRIVRNADTQVRSDRLSTAAEWETPSGGTVRSVGVGGGIAGFGAGLIVIDDPIKNRAESQSITYRDRLWDWFNDDIYTRMEPDASIILIQTRWHEDDLAGRLLREMADGGEQWEVISLPALAETGTASIPACRNASKMLAAPVDPLRRKPGHALCPKRFNARTLLRYKRKLGSYSFSSLYQQRPVPAEGGRFKREWFRNIVDEAPAGLHWKRGYDLAISTKTSADYTASFRVARDAKGNLYIADGFRARIEYPEQRRYIIERMQNEKGTEHGIESAMHGRALVQDLRSEFGPGRFAFRSVNVDSDKLTRALAWLNLAEEGRVFLVRGPWIDAFIEEVASFPSAGHDDQIDAISIAVNMLTEPKKRRSFVAF